MDEVSRLRRAVSKLARELNASAVGEGLTPTQASVLTIIVVRGPLGLGELSRMERINPTMLSRVVGALSEAGLVRRYSDTEDLRAVRVEATDAGRRAHDHIRTERTTIVSEAVAQLSARHATELAQSIEALEALVEQLRKYE